MPQRHLPCQRGHLFTAAVAPVSALCHIAQMPWDQTPREVTKGLTGGLEVTMEYAKRKHPEKGARVGISTGVL